MILQHADWPHPNLGSSATACDVGRGASLRCLGELLAASESGNPWILGLIRKAKSCVFFDESSTIGFCAYHGFSCLGWSILAFQTLTQLILHLERTVRSELSLGGRDNCRWIGYHETSDVSCGLRMRSIFAS